VNCEVCKELLSAFLDNELDESQAALVREHLAVCADCAVVCEDLSAILFTCTSEAEEIDPSNSKAMWCRISNTIESEIKPPQSELTPPPKGRFWSLSLPQLASAVLGIAIISSLLTVVGIRNYLQPSGDDFTTRSAATMSTFEKVLAKVGLIETPQQSRERRLQEQRSAIAYWNNRVQARRVQWDRGTREAFDRNLKVIDESVEQYTQILEQDPDDELSVEMLDAVMSDKMNLLRDFADL
jgi:negative regulator of sigma E activity